jgi:copper chaperone
MKKALAGASAIVALAAAGILLLSGDKRVESAVIAIEGMSCNSCADKISTALSKLEGIEEAKVSLSEGMARVKYDAAKVTIPAMKERITKLGYSVGAVSNPGQKDKDLCEPSDGCCAPKSASSKT